MFFQSIYQPDTKYSADVSASRMFQYWGKKVCYGGCGDGQFLVVGAKRYKNASIGGRRVGVQYWGCEEKKYLFKIRLKHSLGIFYLSVFLLDSGASETHPRQMSC